MVYLHTKNSKTFLSLQFVMARNLPKHSFRHLVTLTLINVIKTCIFFIFAYCYEFFCIRLANRRPQKLSTKLPLAWSMRSSGTGSKRFRIHPKEDGKQYSGDSGPLIVSWRDFLK